MNVQVEKYRLIEWLISVNDERTLEELELIRQREAVSPLGVISPEELVARAKRSNTAIERGEVYDIESILKDS